MYRAPGTSAAQLVQWPPLRSRAAVATALPRGM